MMEHRWGERFRVDLPVRLRSGTGWVGAGWLRDLSVSGAFIATELRIPSLALLQIELKLAGVRHLLDAFVSRHDDAGLGVEWEELSPAVLGLLATSGLAQAASDADPGRVRSAGPRLR
jgi:hypothetical protein